MTLRIRLFGSFQLLDDDRPILIPPPRLQSLIAYLALNRSAPQARRRLAFLFWPDSSEAQAHANLRRELYDLRGLWPEMAEFLHLDRQSLYWINAQAVAVDVAAFEERLAEAENGNHPGAAELPLRQALELYGGELLPHLYDEWVLAERERLAGRYRAALARLTLALEQQGKIADTLETAQRLVAHDPLQESAYRTVMRLMIERGDRAGALRAYESCATMLRAELGVEPDAETERMYRDIVGGTANLAERPARARLNEPPLVGRAAQWAKLLAAWRSAADGQANFVLIAGESGIGKTRLMEELVAWAQLQGHSTAVTRSYEAEGRLAYAPVIEWLRAEAVQHGIDKLQAIWLTEVARLLPEVLVEHPGLTPPQAMTESWQRQRFREALAHALLSAAPPLLLAIDDLQWCDAETLEWLHFLLRYDARARLLVVGTMRVEAVDADHPLTALLTNLRRSGQSTEIALGPLDAGATAELAGHVRGRALDAEQAAFLYTQSEGHPLFVVEMLRASGKAGEALQLTTTPTSASVPPKVQAVIQSRLALLSPASRELAGLAATVGRAFTLDVLAQASDHDEVALVRSLDELWQRRLIREQGDNAYDFSHDRIREAAYAGVSRARRRLLHRRIALALEEVYGVDLDRISGELAAHYEHAGLPEPALTFYEQAGGVAQRIYAHAEASSHLSKGLGLLDQLSVTPDRLQQGLRLRLSLAVSLTVLKGVAAVEAKETYEQAHRLAIEVGDNSERFAALAGLYTNVLSRGELQTAQELVTQRLALAEQVGSASERTLAMGSFSINLFHFGQWKACRSILEQSLDRSNDRSFYTEPLVPVQHSGLAFHRHLTVVLWHLGYPDQALVQMDDALARAQALAHPYTSASIYAWSAWLHQYRREAALAQAQAEKAIDLSLQHGFPYWQEHSGVLLGWAMAQQGQVETGIARMQKSLAIRLTMDAHLHQPAFLSQLAEVYVQAGQPEQGLRTLGEALEVVEFSGERFSLAELYRLKGELLHLQGVDAQEVESHFRQALLVAQQQEAKSLELRAAMSLARFWSQRDRRRDAYDLVAEVYGWFTEGFATPDLQDAKRMLDELA